ncbi:Uncharacterised protein [Klebsiella quasipneumoniae]|nr:Uncharacterised protein [Klebsiella quasipneumoniae]
MPLFYRFTRISAGWRFAYPAYKTIYLSEGYSTPQVRQAPRRRARTAGAMPLVCRVALRLPGLQNHLPIRRLLNTPDPASAAGQRQQARSRLCAGWRFAYPAYKVIYLSEGYSPPQVRQAPRRRARTAGAVPLVCRVALRLPGLQNHLPIRRLLNTPDPASAAPPGKDSGRGAACVPGCASLTRPTKSFTYQKVTHHPRSGKRRAAGQGQRARCRLCAGWRLRLTRPGVRATCR